MHRAKHIERDNIAGVVLQNRLKASHGLLLATFGMVFQGLINDGTDRGVRRIGQTHYSGNIKGVTYDLAIRTGSISINALTLQAFII
jgi:hypothetical protein